MDLLDPASVYLAFFGSGSFLAPEYLAVTLLIAFGIFKFRKIGTPFWSWVLPRRIYGHASALMDVKLLVIGQLMKLLGLFNRIAVTSGIAVITAGLIAEEPQERMLNPWVIAGLLLVLTDFLTYWLHRIYHEWPVMWPLHSLHHSAEVLTPATAYRQHPLADVVSFLFHGLGIGVAQGVFVGLFAQEFSGAQIAGVNAFFFLFAMLVANFRHSHIWISFGPILERIIISPAQHQIHHSINPSHHNKNYGEHLAVWDWMFGSLYLPEHEEVLQFGLSDGSGIAQENPHSTLSAALIKPIVDTRDALRPECNKLKKD